MARLTRVRQKVFASNASNNGVFGSLQAGNPTISNDVATLQSLSAFENGWDDAIEQGDKLPPLEEFQGVQYGISYQQAYMLQEGIPEWDANTPYYKGSLAKTISGAAFKLYCSLSDNNVGNLVSDTANWKLVMDSENTYAMNNEVVHLAGEETITGAKTFTNSLNINNVDGSVELKPSSVSTSGGHIDFHYAGSSADYTSRIIEDASGQLRANCTRLMVPNSVTVGSAIATAAISKGANGYVKLGNGIIIQWGYFSNSSYTQTGTVSLPIAFSNANYALTFGSFRLGQVGYGQGYIVVNSITSTNFVYRLYSGSDFFANQARWIAIGY